MSSFIIIPFIIFIIIMIITSVANNPKLKEMFNEMKGVSNSEERNRNSEEPDYSGLSDEIKMKTSISNDTNNSLGLERKISDKVMEKKEISHNLTEMKSVDFKRLKSRNEEYNEEFKHPAESYGRVEEYDSYTGSLNMDYAGEGCEEHYNVRFISDYVNDKDNQLQLNALQKIIVFGDVINKRKSAR